ncbi:FG-GAP repeat protein [Chloroflexi bacterium TSY]|nr:FG-GAP repeat protein [Chloroflexi bacterium TSY]MBV7329138.1 FG-GAP repeat protein [Chloroflexi bacterium TSY]
MKRMILVRSFFAFILFYASIATLLLPNQTQAQSNEQDQPTLQADWTVFGDKISNFGQIVAGAGDLNGDGFEDVVIGIRDNFAVYLGSAVGLDETAAFTENDIMGGRTSFFPKNVAAAGDVNGDGFDDLVAGSPFDTVDEREKAGRARVYYGGAQGYSSTPAWEVGGFEAEDELGMATDGAGDINGDGYDDVIVGVPGSFDVTIAGSVYIYFGSSSGLSAEPDVRLTNDVAESQFGRALSGAGDVNGDGYADILVGAPRIQTAYVYLGGPEGPDPMPHLTIAKRTGDFIQGAAVDSLGDANGDGYDDIVVNAANIDDIVKAYVFYGSADGLNETPDFTASIKEGDESLKAFVHGVGDLNGDGFADLAFTASPEFSDVDPGHVYVYYGGPNGFGVTPSFVLDGDQVGEFFGASVGGADVNGDGLADLIVGAPDYEEGDELEGKASLFFGSHSRSTGATIAGAPELGGLIWQVDGLRNGTELGAAGAAGDLNGDGNPDLIVATGRERVFIFLGTGGGLAQDASFNLRSQSAQSGLSRTVASGTDINGDGYEDVLVGDPEFAERTGQVALYYGGPDGLQGIRPVWTAKGLEPGLSFGASLAMLGDADGDGFADFAVGSGGDPQNASLSGAVYIYYGGPGGPSRAPGQTLEQEVVAGYDVARAYDVNGDGFDDLLISPSRLNDDVNNSVGNDDGRVMVYHGGWQGLSLTPDFVAENQDAGATFGDAAAAPGDVNGDGFADILISAPGYNEGAGLVALYLGSGDGLGSAPIWSQEGSDAGLRFGVRLAAVGDMTGDGFDDFIVGTVPSEDGLSQLLLYAGGADGPTDEESWALEAEGSVLSPAALTQMGDINGNGFADLFLGEPSVPIGNAAGRIRIFSGGSVEMSEEQIKAAAEELYQKGLALAKEENYADAVLNYDQAIELTPNDARLYFNRGIAYARQEQPQDAIADYTKVIELQPEIAVGYYYRGFSQWALEEYEAAIADMTKAIEIDPERAGIYYNRGRVYRDMREDELAVDDYTASLGLDTELTDTYYQRGFSYTLLSGKGLSDKGQTERGGKKNPP